MERRLGEKNLGRRKNMSKGMVAQRTRGGPFSKGPTQHWVSSDHMLQGKRRHFQKGKGVKSQ